MFSNVIDYFPGWSIPGTSIPIRSVLERARVSAHLFLGVMLHVLAWITSAYCKLPITNILVTTMLCFFPLVLLCMNLERKVLLLFVQFCFSLFTIGVYLILAIFAVYPLAVLSIVFYPMLNLYFLDNVIHYSQMPLSMEMVSRRILFAIFGPFTNKVLGVDTQQVEAREWVMANVEDVALLSFKLYRASNTMDRTLEVLSFFKYKSSRSLIYGMSESTFMTKFNEIFSDCPDAVKASGVTEEVMQAQSLQDHVASLNEFTQYWSTVRNSELAKRAYKMGMYVLSAGVLKYAGISFDGLGYKSFETAALKRKFNFKSVDFITTLLETINFLVTKGYNIYRGASLDSLLDPLSSYEDWIVEVRWLEQKRSFVSNAAAAGFEEFEYRMRLDRAVEQGDIIVKFLSRMKSDDKSMIETRLAAIKKMRDELLILEDAAAMRDPPFSILLVSPPNRGKTSIVSILYTHFGKVCNLATGPGYMYIRNGISDFWDGFKTRMWCLFLDDISFRRVDVCKSGGDPSTMEIINAMNPAPFVPNQAALEDKGKTPLKCKLVIGTTNVKHLNASAYFSTPSAAMRRFRFVVQVTVKPEYANEDGSLSWAKAPKVEGYPDLWSFHIERPTIAADPRQVTMVNVGTFPDRKSFLKWYTSVIRLYLKEVEVVRESEASIHNVEYCDKCSMPLGDCDCPMEAQSSREEMDLSNDNSSWYSHDSHMLENGEMQICHCHHCLNSPVAVEGCTCTHCDMLLEETASHHTWASHDSIYLGEGKMAPCHCHHCSDEFVVDCLCTHCSRLRRIAASEYRVPEVVQRPAIADREPPIEVPPMPHFAYFSYLCDLVGKFFLKGYLSTTIGDAQRQVDADTEESRRENDAMFEVLEQKAGAKSFREFTAFERYHFNRAVDAVNYELAPLRERARMLHEKAQRYVTRPRIFVTLAIVVAAMLASWKMVQTMNSQSTRSPVATNDEKQNVWYTESYDLQTFDSPLDSASIRLGDMYRLLDKATYFVRCRAEGAAVYDCAKWFKVKSYYFVTTSHGLPEGDFTVEAVLAPKTSGCNPNFSCKVSAWQVRRDPNRDLAVIYLPHSNPGRDLTKFMLPNMRNFDSRGEGTLYTRSFGGLFHDARVVYTGRANNIPYGPNSEHMIDGWRYTLTKNSAAGLCGAPLVLHSPRGFVIAGVHAASYYTAGKDEEEFSIDGSFVCAAQGIDVEWFDKMVSSFPINLPGATPTEPLLQCDSRIVTVGPLHHKSPVRFFESGELTVYGTLSSGRVRMKSRVTPHLLAPLIEEEFKWVPEFFKPVMTGWEPWRHPLERFVNPPSLDSGYLKMAADGYLSDIQRDLPKSEVELLHPYDLFTAVNGAAGIGYVDSINRGTSAGFPWKRSKRYYLESDGPCEQAMEPVKPTPEVLARIEIMHAKMKEREMVHPIFVAHLKDEPVSLKKLDAKKTRVFMGAPMDWTILVRQYLLSFVRVVQRNKGVFEAMPGLVCQSVEWDQLYKYLTKFGEKRCDDGDHVAFDHNTPKEASTMAWYVLVSILQWCGGYDATDMNCVHSIAVDASNALVDYNGDLIKLQGSTPSGFALTVIINCMVNSIYMRYAYIKINLRFNHVSECFTFRANVALACYGDDNGFGSRVDWYCVYQISQVLGEDGLQYTPADKGEPKPGFKHIRECAFLKRTWRYEDSLGANVAPLEEKSIRKMLTVWVTSKTVTPQEQAAATVFTAVCEYFWYGRKIFEDRRSRLIKILQVSGLTPYLPKPLPTWDDLAEDFRERSEQATPLFRR